jgi:cell division protein FtsX
MMRATELQARADALEIDVSDAGLSSEESSEHEAEICVLPIWQVPEFTLALAPEQEWGEDEEEDALLEPSDLLEVEAARTGAGLPALSELDELDEFDDEPVLLATLTVDEFDDNPIAITSEPASIPEPEPEFELEPSLEPSEPTLADPIQAPLWRGLNTSVYVFIRGLRGMGQSPLVQLLAIGTMAVCMLLLGTTMLIFANASRVVHDLGIDTPVTVYMQPDVDPATAAALRERIAALPEVARAERVSPEQALARLQAGAGETSERAELLAGIDPSVLPESVEIEFVSGVEPGFADALATRVQGMDGVEEVTVLGPWVQQVERMMTTVRALAIGVALLVSLACLAIVWSTIRLGVFARRSEIQLLRLVGGTASFVRGPFVVEGVVQGILGTALALTGLWLAFELIRPLLERGLALLFAAGSLQFFSNVEMIVALGFGALLGLIGSRAAVARHAEA